MPAAKPANVVPLPAPRAVVSATAVWPIPGDVPDLNTIIDDQAATIAAQAALIDAYQGNLNAKQNPLPGTPAVATATATGTQLAVAATPAIVGTIMVGATITDGVTVPAGTTILGQISGTPGKDGIYLTSQATTAAATVLTFTPPPTPQSWPTPTDAPTLALIQQQQTAILRLQSSLLQTYQDLLNISQTPAPPTGP